MESEKSDNYCPICYVDYTSTIDTPETQEIIVCPAFHGICNTCYTRILRGDTKKRCPMCRDTMFDWKKQLLKKRRRPLRRLTGHSSQALRRYRCGECHKEGHNRTTCPHLAHIRDGERKIKIQQQFHFYLRMITFSIFIFIILKFEID